MPVAQDALPTCPVCSEALGTHGGPCALPCGHNGCCFCLQEIQARKPECPLCRSSFPHDFSLRPNPVLQRLLTTASVGAGGAEEDGWERVPSRANTIRMYTQDLGGALSAGSPRSSSDGVATHARSVCDVSPAAADEGTPAPSTQLIVRQAAAQHMQSPRSEPLSILMGSYHTASGGFSYESILAWVPPQWMPDSCAPACKSCCLPFKPVVRLRHHCRLCGLVFCHNCSMRKLLLPPKFGYREPQRVCDACYDVLRAADLQNALAGHFSRAAQPPVHDVTDWTSMRAWLNNPLSMSLEQDIFKCSNILGHFVSGSRLSVERTIPATLMQHAAGFAILSVLKVGMGWSAAVGTGLVVARRPDGAWSPPSAIGLGSFGWGIQVGGELADLLLILNDMETVKAFCGDVHLGVAGNVNVTVGPVGRDASASVTVGKRGCAMVYSYSCSRGAFLGASIDGTVTHTRSNANLAFYGRPLTAKDLLIGGMVEAPPAARALYSGLDSMINSFGYSQLPQQAIALQHAAGAGQPLRLPLNSTFSVDDFVAERSNDGVAACEVVGPAGETVSELPDSIHAAMQRGLAQRPPDAAHAALLLPALDSDAAPASVADVASEVSDEVPYSLFDD